MSVKHEDNFGFYCTDSDTEELAFFCYIKSQSKPKLCVRCHQQVSLLEHIQTCATCAQALEYGASSDPTCPL
jgi:predicted amidophosphoribosyltransferase